MRQADDGLGDFDDSVISDVVFVEIETEKSEIFEFVEKISSDFCTIDTYTIDSASKGQFF